MRTKNGRRQGFKMLAVMLLLSLLFFSCTPQNGSSETANDDTAQFEETIAEQEQIIQELTQEKEVLISQVESLEEQVNQLEMQLSSTSSGSLLMTAMTLVEFIGDENFEAVAQYVDPVDGVRFSPYGYVNVTTDRVYSAQDLETAMQDQTVYNWGSFDGTGDPIDMDFDDYYGRFIYDQDYANPHMIGNNTVVGTGNTLVNISQVYPGASFVEFHFTGFDPNHDGLDWRSLRLVLEEQNGDWVLLGIIHDEWTI